MAEHFLITITKSFYQAPITRLFYTHVLTSKRFGNNSVPRRGQAARNGSERCHKCTRNSKGTTERRVEEDISVCVVFPKRNYKLARRI